MNANTKTIKGGSPTKMETSKKVKSNVTKSTGLQLQEPPPEVENRESIHTPAQYSQDNTQWVHGEKRKVVRRILKNFISLTGANFICKVLAYISTAYLARVLSTEGFGILGFAQAVIVYFQLLLNQGLDTYGTREIAKDRNSVSRYVSNILTIRLLLSAISYLLLVIFAILIPKPLVVKGVILILGLRLFVTAFNIKWVFQGIEKMEWIALSRIVPQVLFVAGVFVLIKNPEQIMNVPLLQVATASIGIATLIFIYRKGQGKIAFNFDLPFWKEIFRQSLPMGATYFLIQVYTNFDVILLGFTHGEGTVGLYSAAYKVILIINLFGIYYFTTLFPNISRMYAESSEKLKGLLSKSMRIITLVVLPLCVGGTILARPLLTFIYGNDFSGSALPFRILIWNVAVVWIGLHYGNTLIACNKQKYYMASVGAGALINIVLNLIFIPRYGMIAAAITTLFSEFVVLIATQRKLKGIIPLNSPILFLRPAPASLLMGISIYLMPDMHVLLKILSGAGTYILAAILTKAVGKSDLVIIKSALSKN